MAEREGIARVVTWAGWATALGRRTFAAGPPGSSPSWGPLLTYPRAGMISGEGSESYRTLGYLVQRLPAMIGPEWLKTPTQAIGIDDVIAYLVEAPDVSASDGREVQIAGPDVLSYGEMLDLVANALGCGAARGCRCRS